MSPFIHAPPARLVSALPPAGRRQALAADRFITPAPSLTSAPRYAARVAVSDRSCIARPPAMA